LRLCGCCLQLERHIVVLLVVVEVAEPPCEGFVLNLTLSDIAH
jgi:hypothetical protein